MLTIFDEFITLFNHELDNAFKTNKSAPSQNIKENDTSFTVKFDMPGFERNEIDIEIVDSPNKPFTSEAHIGLLRVTAKNNERSVKKAWYLTGNINQDNIDASLKNGVLTIVLQKQDAKPKTTKKILIK